MLLDIAVLMSIKVEESHLQLASQIQKSIGQKYTGMGQTSKNTEEAGRETVLKELQHSLRRPLKEVSYCQAVTAAPRAASAFSAPHRRLHEGGLLKNCPPMRLCPSKVASGVLFRPDNNSQSHICLNLRGRWRTYLASLIPPARSACHYTLSSRMAT